MVAMATVRPTAPSSAAMMGWMPRYIGYVRIGKQLGDPEQPTTTPPTTTTTSTLQHPQPRINNAPPTTQHNKPPATPLVYSLSAPACIL